VHQDDGSSAEISIDGTSHRVIYCHPAIGQTFLSLEGSSEQFINQLSSRVTEDKSAGSGHILAPMHGQVIEVCVSEGETVVNGQRLLVVEAMKMQHEILAGVDGFVKSVNARPGEQVAADQLIMEIESEGD
jgi:geranyl-CoA carboxylase alpha subunit